MTLGLVGGRHSWRRRLKQFVGLHLRQVPCVHAAVEAIPDKLRFWRRRSYQTLGQDEEGDGTEAEDMRQAANKTVGSVVVKLAMLSMVGITIMLVARNSTYDSRAPDWETVLSPEEFDAEEFKRDAPVVLYLGAVELLVCGACAQTAASMYTRRRHALRHPKDGTERERARYIKVLLEKDPGQGDQQLYGLGFRPSSDGLECLLVEDIRRGSLLWQWNLRALRPSPEDMVEAALGGIDIDMEVSPGEGEGGAAPERTEAGAGGDLAAPQRRRPIERVHPGAAVVAVNNVAADVGMMQAELVKARVTLWVRSEVYHPSQLESEVLAEPDAVIVAGNRGPHPAGPEAVEVATRVPTSATSPRLGPVFLGRPVEDPEDAAAAEADVAAAVSGPRCACVAFEDEEPQILTRWLVCSVIFGWVTLVPVLLMQPHEERPRQHLFRRYLLKPCIIILPVWMLFWVLDCIEVLIKVQIIHPFYYFAIAHMILPAILVRALFQLQQADESLVLEQRKARQADLAKEASNLPPVVVEDPSPTLLKEFIAVNPVALVWLGAVASVPIVAFSLLTPMATARARLAQGYVHLIYGPLIFMQLTFAYILYHVRFVDLPKFYLGCFGLLLSVPCFVIWCFCLMCASRYGRQDMHLVEQQRLERAREACLRALPVAMPELQPASAQQLPGTNLVDLTEAMHREWEFIFTA